jgi:peptidoglycan/LPS O-acetylase OafA/YrhL
MRATRQTGRPAAVALGLLLTLAVLAFVSDAVDPEAFSPAPAAPTVGIGLLAAGVPPASVAPPALPVVVDGDSRAPPRA